MNFGRPARLWAASNSKCLSVVPSRKENGIRWWYLLSMSIENCVKPKLKCPLLSKVKMSPFGLSSVRAHHWSDHCGECCPWHWAKGAERPTSRSQRAPERKNLLMWHLPGYRLPRPRHVADPDAPASGSCYPEC